LADKIPFVLGLVFAGLAWTMNQIIGVIGDSRAVSYKDLTQARATNHAFEIENVNPTVVHKNLTFVVFEPGNSAVQFVDKENEITSGTMVFALAARRGQQTQGMRKYVIPALPPYSKIRLAATTEADSDLEIMLDPSSGGEAVLFEKRNLAHHVARHQRLIYGLGMLGFLGAASTYVAKVVWPCRRAAAGMGNGAQGASDPSRDHANRNGV
jgi:hypothetical protein